MSYLLGILLLLLGLVVSIALHEVGHMVPAKKFGVRVPQYFVGFGPTVWSTKRGETEYGIKAIPLGGFVRMIGMFGPKPGPDPEAGLSEESREELRGRRRGLLGWARNVTDDARSYSMEEVRPGEEHRAFYHLSTPKKLVVMFGGPFMNLVIAFVLIAVVFVGFGLPQVSTKVYQVTPCVQTTAGAECGANDPAGPAQAAGLQAGDRILSWGGVETPQWSDVTQAIRAGGTDPVDVVVERDGARQNLTITPVLVDRPVLDASGVAEKNADGTVKTTPTPAVGMVASRELVRQSVADVPEVTWATFTGTVKVVVTLPQRLVSIAGSVFGGGERDPNVVGLIGVGRMAGEVTAEGGGDLGAAGTAVNLLMMLASLNMALFVFNLIPLLPLDGGHIAGALYEGGRRRIAAWRNRPDPGHADTARLMPLTYAVFAVMMGMTVLLAIADIVKPVTLT